MREAAEFFLDFLIEYDGYLVTCPSVSPENTYILHNGEQGANGIGVTMDNQRFIQPVYKGSRSSGS